MKAIANYFAFLIFALLFNCAHVFAQNNIKQGKFYAGINMGVGFVKFAQNNLPASRNGNFALGFKIGYRPNNWLRTGLLINGWLIESFGLFYDDPSRGISISNTFVQVELFPFEKKQLFFTLAGGLAHYTNHHADVYNANGYGGLLGIGYELKLVKRMYVSLQCNYGFGSFEDVLFPPPAKNQHYNVAEILICFSYH